MNKTSSKAKLENKLLFILAYFIFTIPTLSYSLSTLASDCIISTNSSSSINIFPNYPKQSSVLVTVYSDKKIDKNSVIKFGIPFPINTVSDIKQLKILKDGIELPSHIKETLKWREFDSDCEYIRAIQVYVNYEDDFNKPQMLEIKWGERHSRSLDVDAASAVEVHATMSPKYLGDCMLRTRTTPIGTNDKESFWKKYENFYLGFSQTAINNFDLQDYATWQLERDSAIWNVYIRTGELTWLKEAIKNTKIYAENIRSNFGSKSDGSFVLKNPSSDERIYDNKYSYGQGILNLLMLTGDDRYASKIISIANIVGKIDVDYEPGNFFTERHTAFALLGALNAWELTANEKYKTRAEEIVRNIRLMQEQPKNNWNSIGAPLHRIRDHEGCTGDTPVSSPWMGALLAEAVWRYYIFSGDPEALVYISKYGDFVVNFGLYTIQHAGARFHGLMAPHYLASDVFYSSGGNSCKNRTTNIWHHGNIEHVPDVLGLLIRSRYAKRILGEEVSDITKSINELKKSTIALFSFWKRSSWEPEYRIEPHRKYNWWFQAHSDIAYMD